MEILGVDFSGASGDRATWLTRGTLDEDGLRLTGCESISRAALTELLAGLPGPAVAALDFPFGTPEACANWLAPGAATMVDQWQAADRLTLAEFMKLRDDFVAAHGELKRAGDWHYRGCFSPLHRVNPNMVPMTFYGMRMLARLWEAGYSVPPLPPRPASRAELLEAMPGAALAAWKLPSKGYKNGGRAPELRRRILAGLPRRSVAPLHGLAALEGLALASHDALDSIVAALAAAAWAINPAGFRQPAPAEMKAAQLEGWLYAPHPAPVWPTKVIKARGL